MLILILLYNFVVYIATEERGQLFPPRGHLRPLIQDTTYPLYS
jgi:hypothetical protein